MDIAYTASDYPVNGSQVYRLNFLQQFLCEVEYTSSPEAVRSLQEVGGCDGSEFQGEIVEWNPNMNITLNYDLTMPHIYKHLGSIKFVFLRRNTTVCVNCSFDVEFQFTRRESDRYVL